MGPSHYVVLINKAFRQILQTDGRNILQNPTLLVQIVKCQFHAAEPTCKDAKTISEHLMLIFKRFIQQKANILLHWCRKLFSRS